MRNIDGFFLGLLIGIVWAGLIMFIFIPNISLPEEYDKITTNHYKPDTLLGYYIDNKLHIEFKPK